MNTASTRKIAALVLLPLAAFPARAAERSLAPSASDAPSYARACDAYGASYFAVPGSDICLSFGGVAAAQLEPRNLTNWLPSPPPGAALPFTSTSRPAQQFGGAFAVGLNATARLPTEAGLISAYVSGIAGYAGASNPSTWSNLSRLDFAYLTFAGWTAGRAQSAFDFYADAWNFTPLRGSNTRTELVSYAFAPTPGVTAVVSVENPRERWGAIGQTIVPNATAANTGPVAPDLVGAVRIESPFGLAQISGAVHQLQTAYTAPPSVNPPGASSSQWGFAAQGGLKVNLPALSDADAMILQATYARGASAYVAGDNQSTFGDFGRPSLSGPNLSGVGPGLSAYDYDCVVGAQPFGRCDKSSGYAIVAALKHFWSPTVSSSLFASVFGMNYPDAVNQSSATVAGAGDYRETIVGGNLAWTPLKNLMIGGELSYTLSKTQTPQPSTNSDHWTASPEWSGRVRVQQKF
ncbi:hypothetical protein M2321_000948 [Rhodoblastus acidophilus]|nr:porin [Rhodoblastus acidophilus]MCW2273379.1 hypothetical protein [Rhodoblastus acidophilus]